MTSRARRLGVVAAIGKGTARVTGVTVADGQRRLLALDAGEISGLDVQWPARVAIGRIRLKHPDAVVDRDADGAIVIPALKPPTAQAPTAPAAAMPASTLPTVTVVAHEVAVENGALTWRDRSVEPAATVRLAGTRLVVKEPTWPLAGPVALELAAATPEGGALRVSGTVGIQPMTADVKVTARGVALAPYAPYLATAAPVAGYADADVAATVSRNPELAARVRGTAGLSRVSVVDGKRRLLSVERVDARGVDVEWPGRVSVARLTWA